MTTTRPTTFPDYATDANYSTGPHLGTPTKIALTTGEVQTGNVAGTSPDPRKFNAWQNQVGVWTHYLDERANDFDIDKLPIPERYLLPGETPASMDAAKGWEVAIKAMLAANSVCSLTPGKVYEISGGDLPFNAGNVLFMRGATIKKKAGCAPSTNSAYIQSVNNVSIIGPGTFDGSLTSDGAAVTFGNLLYVQDVDGLFVDNIVVKDVGAATITGSACGFRSRGYLRNATINGVSYNQSAASVGNGATGFFADGVLTNVTMSGGASEAAGFKVCVGFDVTSMEQVTCTDVAMKNGAVHGIMIGYSATNAHMGIKVVRPRISNFGWNGIYNQSAGSYGTEIIDPDIEFCGGAGTSGIGQSGIFTNAKDTLVRGGEIRDSGYIKGGGSRGQAFPFVSFGSNGQVVDGTKITRSNWGTGYVSDPVLFTMRDVVVSASAWDTNFGFYYQSGSYHGVINLEGVRSNVFVSVGAYSSAAAPVVNAHGCHFIGPDLVSGTTATTCALDCSYIYGGDISGNEFSGWNGTAGGAMRMQGDSPGLRDGTLRIHDNYGSRNDSALRVVGISGGALNVYTEPQDAVVSTNGTVVTGAGAARHRTIEQWWPTKIVRSNTAAASGEETWKFGDVIRPATACITANELFRMAVNASPADPGTWKTVIGT